MGFSQDEEFIKQKELKQRINLFVLSLKATGRLEHLHVDLILNSFCSVNKSERERLEDEAYAKWLLRPFSLFRSMEGAEILINSGSFIG
jgi:hypothetical protein